MFSRIMQKKEEDFSRNFSKNYSPFLLQKYNVFLRVKGPTELLNGPREFFLKRKGNFY